MDEQPLDCLVIGAGPAGLTAAIYLARFHLSILVVDSGKGRAATIPCTHNHAGYPEGVAGSQLTPAFWKRHLGALTGTARNWNTMRKLQQLAAEMA